jgi:hypothetical protein
VRPSETDADFINFEEFQAASGAELGTKGVAIAQVTSERNALAAVNEGSPERAGKNTGATPNAFILVGQFGTSSRAVINGISGANRLARCLHTLQTIDGDVNDIAFSFRSYDTNSGLFGIRLLLVGEGTHGLADTAANTFCRVNN